MVSELVTAIIIVIVIIAIVFGFYVGSERDAMVEAAESCLAVVKPRADAAGEGWKLIACDDSLVLASMFIATRKPMATTPSSLPCIFTKRLKKKVRMRFAGSK